MCQGKKASKHMAVLCYSVVQRLVNDAKAGEAGQVPTGMGGSRVYFA